MNLKKGMFLFVLILSLAITGCVSSQDAVKAQDYMDKLAGILNRQMQLGLEFNEMLENADEVSDEEAITKMTDFNERSQKIYIDFQMIAVPHDDFRAAHEQFATLVSTASKSIGMMYDTVVNDVPVNNSEVIDIMDQQAKAGRQFFTDIKPLMEKYKASFPIDQELAKKAIGLMNNL
ncbi:hypothetical protein ACFLFF_25155 [Brevibacillus reuszeri]|uniref:hypothetical protein n=1 Tax=Brevibacillus reuszeri TaxID=54915 RepID=UPI003670A201